MEVSRPGKTDQSGHDRPDEARFQRVAEELLRTLRADTNQRELSQRLGYSFNQVGKWETGSTKIKWKDFLRFAAVKEAPVENAFRDVFWNFSGEFDSKSTLISLLKNLNLAEVDWFESKARAWTKGDVEPDLAEVLQAMHVAPALLFSWLSKFTDGSKLASLGEGYRAYEAMVETILADPICVYVNAALRLDGYTKLAVHDDAFVAHHATCTVAHVRRVLALMTESGILRFDGKKYLANPADFSFSTSANAKLRPLTKYTTTLAAERYPLLPLKSTGAAPPTAAIGSVRVVAMSAQTSIEVRDLIAKFHVDLAEVVKRDDGAKEAVQILLVQSFGSTANAPALSS